MANKKDYYLRKIESSDLEMVLDWRNSDRIRANMYTDRIITLKEHLTWYEKIKNDNSVEYLIYQYQNKPIGLVNFTKIDILNSKCYWGFYLGEINVHKGSGTVLGFMSMEYIFFTLNIRKVCSEVFVFNEKSLKLHQKMGFEKEGVFKQHIYKNNQYQDVICLALFKDTWLQNKDLIHKTLFRI